MTPELQERQIRGACPLDCPDTCAWMVTVKNGEPVALRGAPAHPYARGSLCNKVENYLNLRSLFGPAAVSHAPHRPEG